MQRKFGTTLLLLIAASVVMLTPRSAFGLGGCVDSPEDPTAVMAILGGLAATIPLVSSRLRSRKRKQ